MSGGTKRLDLQFGSFACSVRGFDDPVQPVQQVLQALQSLLEETPELGDSGIHFDAGAIERLIGEVARRADVDETNVEIVPGLIIVHRGGAGAAGYPDPDDKTERLLPDDPAGSDEADTWVQGFAADLADHSGAKAKKAAPTKKTDTAALDETGDNEPEGDTSEYVNIFAPKGDSNTKGKPASSLFRASAGDQPEDAVESDEAAPESDPGDARISEEAGSASKNDPGSDGLEEKPDDEPLRSLFAQAVGTADDDMFANLMAEDNSADDINDEDAPINLFSSGGRTKQREDDVGDALDDLSNALSDAKQSDPMEMPKEAEAERGEALFGESDDQPDVPEADEGYTAAGLAEAAKAETVPDLMVSAAAWLVLIQGQTTFSRNDVVKVFQSIPGDHSSSLEARIKGFGKAVRNDQLILVEDGVFGLSREELERYQRLL